MPLLVSLSTLDGADRDEAAFVALAVARLGEAVRSPDFLAAIASATYVETRWMPAAGPSRVFTPTQIATRIGEGRERGSSADQRLDFALKLVELPGPDSGRAVLGSTWLGQPTISTARWFVRRCMERGDAVNLASHLMHEWCHLSGFYHWPDNTARGDTAYVVEQLVRDALAAEHGAEIDPAITALMHDVRTDCGCRGNAPAPRETMPG